MKALQVLAGILVAFTLSNSAELVPPGRGTRLPELGDTFEEVGWSYNFNNPKLYNQYHNPGSGWVEVIHAPNAPTSVSVNGRWIEGPTRGHPDIVEQVRTPPGGIPGSQYSLRLRTTNSGTPKITEGTVQQDDLLNIIPGKTNADIPLGSGLNVVTRIYLPPLNEWHDMGGYHIGFRVGATGRKPDGTLANYWPGIWIWMDKESSGRRSFRWVVRANNEGVDVNASEQKFTNTGWWTLGMGFNLDGSISYYASPGVDDLTPRDLLTFRAGSQSAAATYTPYQFKFDNLDYLFFSTGNTDGQNSTEFIIDDVGVYRVEP